MTNEEAIEIIKCGDISNRWGDSGKVAESMAITALKQQPILDKIRAEIIEACGYSKDYVGTFDYTTTYLKIVLQIIDKYKEESEVPT